MFFKESFQIRAAYLFLAFHQQDHIDLHITPFLQSRFNTENVAQNLALVVGCSSAVNLILYDYRFEWRRLPKIQGIRRLDVVMTVNQDRLSTRPLFVAGHDPRMASGRV